jgi:hypothetical protein
MNMLKKGPELKRPDLKVPDFLLDIYYDLKERHLLPLVAILLVALVALPIALSQASGSEAEEEAASDAVATPSTATQTSSLVVAKAAPGLRAYHRRLDRTPRNPFKQPIQSTEGEGPEGPTSIEEVTIGGEPEEIPSGGEGGPTGSPEGGDTPPGNGNLKYYSWSIDVRIAPVSSDKDKTEATVRHNLPEMTMLPSRSVPALTFVGVTKDEKNAVMLVSDKVTGLFGDATCVVGSEACQMVVLEPEIPETVVYGADSRTYRIELLKVQLTETDKLNTAPLGKSNKKGGKGKEQKLDRGLLGPAPTAVSR